MPDDPAPHNDEVFTTGDMVPVSSDEVTFKVDSVLVLAARYVKVTGDCRSHCILGKRQEADIPCSRVLRDAWGLTLADRTIGPVRFPDPDFETAATIRTFLELITTGKPHSPLAESAGASVLRFLHKYDCPTTAGHLAAYFLAKDSSTNAALAFAAAAYADNAELASFIVGRHGAMNIQGYISYSAFQMMPPTYAWALGRCVVASSPNLSHYINEAKGTYMTCRQGRG